MFQFLLFSTCHPSTPEKEQRRAKETRECLPILPSQALSESSRVDCTFPLCRQHSRLSLEEFVLYLKGRVVGEGRGGEEERGEGRGGPIPPRVGGAERPDAAGLRAQECAVRPAGWPRRRAPERRGRGGGGHDPPTARRAPPRRLGPFRPRFGPARRPSRPPLPPAQPRRAASCGQ